MSTSTTYTVVGMTCGGCVRKVREAVATVDGVTDVDIKFKGGVVTVASNSPVDSVAIRSAVEAVGYEVAP